MSDYPLLVAPRPVRLGVACHAVVNRAHPHSAHDRVRIADSSPLNTLFSDSSSDKDSPRSSPRSVSVNTQSLLSSSLCSSGLPSEALEEFLSILRPSLPVPRSRRQAASLPAHPHDRPLIFQARNTLDLLSETTDIPDDMDTSRSQQPSRNSICRTPDPMNEDESTFDVDNDNLPFRWYKSNVLFMISPLSPAAIPLPQPTPDEMVDML
ncbi:hypothetical protein C0995_001503 [Termitomyces sp. Mi166|nr:hypothetical protein C0995_001503 [Termitomyces sp. Mi166\